MRRTLVATIGLAALIFTTRWTDVGAAQIPREALTRLIAQDVDIEVVGNISDSTQFTKTESGILRGEERVGSGSLRETERLIRRVGALAITFTQLGTVPEAEWRQGETYHYASIRCLEARKLISDVRIAGEPSETRIARFNLTPLMANHLVLDRWNNPWFRLGHRKLLSVQNIEYDISGTSARAEYSWKYDSMTPLMWCLAFNMRRAYWFYPEEIALSWDNASFRSYAWKAQDRFLASPTSSKYAGWATFVYDQIGRSWTARDGRILATKVKGDAVPIFHTVLR